MLLNALNPAATDQCDQIFTAVINKRCAEILPNWIFFYQTHANPLFEISGFIQSM